MPRGRPTTGVVGVILVLGLEAVWDLAEAGAIGLGVEGPDAVGAAAWEPTANAPSSVTTVASVAATLRGVALLLCLTLVDLSRC